MRVVFEIFTCFCYRRTRNQILQLLLHGNYVVAVFQLDLVNIVRSLNKINLNWDVKLGFTLPKTLLCDDWSEFMRNILYSDSKKCFCIYCICY